MAELDRTCWRGIEIGHPSQWEPVILSGPDADGHLILADRYHQRLELKWKQVDFEPNVDMVMDRYRQEDGAEADFRPMEQAPAGWMGVLRPLAKRGAMAHLGRFFPRDRTLVEATVLWPSRRDVNLEKAVVSSICPQDSKAGVRTWQAMGTSVDIAVDCDLVEVDNTVGRIRWTFATDEKRGMRISVERIAMAEYWLDEPLREWLVRELPEGFKVVRQEAADLGAHRAERLMSSSRIHVLATIRGLRQVRLDAAWQCPIEGRVYRITATQDSRETAISLPAHLNVRCCKAPPTGGRE